MRAPGERAVLHSHPRMSHARPRELDKAIRFEAYHPFVREQRLDPGSGLLFLGGLPEVGARRHADVRSSFRHRLADLDLDALRKRQTRHY